MTIKLNGELYQTRASNLLALLEETDENGTSEGKAIAVNDEVVPSDSWQECELSEGDRVEIVQAYQGG